MPKVSGYAGLTAVADGDVLPVVDVSDVSMAASGTTKKVTARNLLSYPGFNVLNPSFAGGADNTGAAFSDSAFQACATAALAFGAPMTLPPGTYKTSTTVNVVMTTRPVRVEGGGKWMTTWNYTGSGDCLRIYNSVYGGNQPTADGGGVTGLRIDGSGAAAGACGIHAGDQTGLTFDAAVTNFSGAGSVGVRFDNRLWWTEQLRGLLWVYNCTQAVVFDVTDDGVTKTSTGSFGFCDDLHIYVNCAANQDGVVLQNGANVYGGEIKVRGNFQGSGSAVTNGALRISGTVPTGHPGAGTPSTMTGIDGDVQCEVTGSFAFVPQTIIFGGNTNYITGHGTMRFAGFSPSNLGAASGVMNWIGLLIGDSNLNPAGAGTDPTVNQSPVVVGPLIYGKGSLSTTGQLGSAGGDVFRVQLTANIATLSLTPFVSAVGGPQRKTVIIQQAASGGPFTVGWQANGSPTLAAPTIKWAGGTSPVMSATASCYDVYELVTDDGVRWFGARTVTAAL